MDLCKNEKLRLLVQPLVVMAVCNRQDNDCCDAMQVASTVLVTLHKDAMECYCSAHLNWEKGMVYRPLDLVVDGVRSLCDGRARLQK